MDIYVKSFNLLIFKIINEIEHLLSFDLHIYKDHTWSLSRIDMLIIISRT